MSEQPFYSIELVLRSITTVKQFVAFVASLRADADEEVSNVYINLKLNKITPAQAAQQVFDRRYGEGTNIGWLYHHTL